MSTNAPGHDLARLRCGTVPVGMNKTSPPLCVTGGEPLVVCHFRYRRFNDRGMQHPMTLGTKVRNGEDICDLSRARGRGSRFCAMPRHRVFRLEVSELQPPVAAYAESLPNWTLTADPTTKIERRGMHRQDFAAASDGTRVQCCAAMIVPSGNGSFLP
jgi:hypothetical protein